MAFKRTVTLLARFRFPAIRFYAPRYCHSADARMRMQNALLLKLNRKKNSQLICFIEISSILAHAKTQLSQAVKPYSFNVVKRRGF